MYADDNTPFTAILQRKIQHEATSVSNWFLKNDMVVSGEKTKLMTVTTEANRASKLTPGDIILHVNVCGDLKHETKSEKLLGITMNNQLNWKNHLYGDGENLGLVKELSQRIGMLRQVRRYVSDKTFKTVLNGMFISKLIYGITIYGAVWGLQGILNDEPVNSTSISKEDMRVLQVLQNKALRLLLRKPRETPVINLLKESNQMSVHQLVAYHTANQTFKVFRNQEPSYHYQRLFGDDVNQQSTRAATHLEGRVEFNRSLGRYSFFYQASHIWRNLPYHIKTAQTVENFKKALKPWILRTISMKP